MVSLRAPRSWQPGVQLDLREGGDVEASVGRAGLLLARRRCNIVRTAVQRRTRRIRANLRPYGGVSRAVHAFGAYGASADAEDYTETMDFSNNPLSQACRRLRLESADELQDLIASLILSECVYKKLELDEAGVVAKVAQFVSSFPPGWVELQAVQLSLAGIPQHYLIATSPTSMYVAFMGTKQFQDILADANLLHTPIWAESARLAADRQSIPAAHRGFLERARAIHVEQLYELAISRGLRLVLCGHSLGGAVAKLCTLRLLRELPDWPRPRVRCIAFATPAVGNAALAELVESAGWAGHFATYYLPEDQLVRLISFSQARTSPGSSSSSGASGGSGAAACSRGNAGSCDTAAGSSSGGGRKGSRARAERRRRAKEGSRVGRGADACSGVLGIGGGVVGGEGMPAMTTGAVVASPAVEPPRLVEASLGRLNTAAAPAAATATAAPQPQLRLQAQLPARLARASSASSIASIASSYASGATSISSDMSTSGRSSSLHRRGSSNLSFRGAGTSLEPQDDACPSSASSSYSSMSRSTSTVDRTRSSSSSGGNGGGSLMGFLSLQTLAASVLLPLPMATEAGGGTAAAVAATKEPGRGGGGGVGKMSVAESLDEDQAGVAMAMEEILAPGPDELEAAAAAGVALSGKPPTDLAAAQREALYGNTGGSWGLRLALGRKRVMRQLRRLAARTRIPLPKELLPVSRYHTFGTQWFVTEHGALSPEELESQLRAQREPDQQQLQQQQLQQHTQQQPQQQQQQQVVSLVTEPAATPPLPATAATAGGTVGFASPEGARGLFSFHRMVAYRQRYADLISRLVGADAGGKGPQISSRPPPTVTAGAAMAADDLVQLQQLSQAAAPAAAGAMPCGPLPPGLPYSCAVQLSDSLLPRISVQRAVLQGMLPESRVGSAAAAAISAATPAEFSRRPHAKSQHHHYVDVLARPPADEEQRTVATAERIASSYAAGRNGESGGSGAPAGRTGDTSTRPVAIAALVVGYFLRWVWDGDGGGGGESMYGRPGGGAGRARGSPDELVRLDLELEGHNLQYCRKVSVTLVWDNVVGTAAAAVAGAASVSLDASAAGQAGPAAAAAAVSGQIQAHWAPFPVVMSSVNGVASDGSSSTVAAAAGRVAPHQQQQTAEPGTLSSAPQPAVAPQPTMTTANPLPPLPALSSPPAASSPGVRFPGHTNPGPIAALPSSGGGTPSSGTLVPCEVVQVLYAQPYSDEANPPPLHPVSLFRNTLHHFAGNFMRRCRLQGQGQAQAGAGALTGAASASTSSAGAGSGCAAAVALAEAGMDGRVGPWRCFRFQQQNNWPITNSTTTITEGFASAAAAKAAQGRFPSGSGFDTSSDEGSSFSALRKSPGGFIGGMAATRPDGGGTAVATDAVVTMPSRLLLRVTLPLCAAQGLLDGTLPARLVVSARSDFHALSDVPVTVHRPRVAILGTSPYAASLVQAALSAPAALAAASLDERAPAGAAGGGALGAVAGLTAWVPPPVTWALSAVCSAVGAASVRRAVTAAATTAVRAGTIAASQAGMAGSVPPAPLPPSPPRPAPVAPAPVAAAPLLNARPGNGLAAQTHDALGARRGPAAGVKAAEPGQRGNGFAPWWVRVAAQGRMLRIRARWGIRQSLAAAAVGAAAASAAGATGAAAAVGAAAVVASTVAAFHSDGGVSVFTNAAVTMAAVVAAAAVAATAFTGSEVAVLIAAAASAAAVAMAAATSSGDGIPSKQPLPPPQPPPLPAQQQQATSSKEAAAGCSRRSPAALLHAIPHGLPVSVPAPRLGPAPPPTASGKATASVSVSVLADTSAAGAATGPAAGNASASEPWPGSAPQGARWVLRFGGRPAAAQSSGRSQQNRSERGSTAAAGSGGGSPGGGAVRPVGRGWVLWWPGSVQHAPLDGGTAPGARAAAAAAAMPSPSPSPLLAHPATWLPWPLPSARPDRRPSSCTATVSGGGSAVSATVSTRTISSATQPSAAAGATELRHRSRPWFPPPLGGTAAQLRRMATATSGTEAIASVAAAAGVQPTLGCGSGGGSGGVAAAAAVSLAQLRSQLLRRLTAGSGRAVLPLPPRVLSDGLELCNVMAEPASRSWGSAHGGGSNATAATAAGQQHVLPLRRPRGGGVAAGPPPPPVLLEPVPAAQLWKVRCRGGSPPGGVQQSATAAAAAAAAASPAVPVASAAAPPSSAPPAVLLLSPRAARVALDGAATAATAAVAAMLGGMPAVHEGGCPELVGVAPFVAVRRLEEGLRRQVPQRGLWWRALLGGVVGVLLRPVALVGMLGRLPGWGLQVLRRGHPSAGASSVSHGSSATCHNPLEMQPAATSMPPDQRRPPLPAGSVVARHGGGGAAAAGASPPRTSSSDWGVLVVVASCRDPLRVLRGRDIEALRNRAADASCPLVPVLLTCPESPPGRRSAALRTLAAACGVAASEVRVVWLDAALLHQPAAVIPRADLAAVWRGTVDCEGAPELRKAVRQAMAAAAAATPAERQEFYLQN